jgi:hypothetical protein
MNNHDYGGRPLDIKPCVSVAPHINNHDYVDRPLDKGNNKITELQTILQRESRNS